MIAENSSIIDGGHNYNQDRILVADDEEFCIASLKIMLQKA
jgi:hypothetical protein